MQQSILKYYVSASNFIGRAKERTFDILKNNRGDVNYPLTVAMFSVIILVFGYPILKSIVTTIFGDIQTWWTSNGRKIFEQAVNNQ